MSVVVYETDIGEYLKKNGKFTNLVFKSGDYPFTVKIEKVSELKGGNKLLQQQAQDKAWPAIKKMLPGLISELEAADAKPDEAKRDKAATKAMDKFLDESCEDVIAVCQKVFTDFAKDRKDYKVFKAKKGAGIAISGLSLAGSIALTAASGWSGVGTVVGAVGIVRSSASLAQQIYNVAVDVEKIYDRIVENVMKMRKQLTSSTIKENTGKQIAATVLNKVFAVEIETLLVTVDRIEEDFKLLQGRVKGCKSNAVSLANDIPKLMKKQDEIAVEVKALQDLGVRTNKEQSKLGKLQVEEKDLEHRLDRLLKEITGISDKINKIEAWSGTYEKEISSLSSKYNGKATKAVGIAAELIISATSFVGGNFASPASTVSDLHKAAKSVATGLAIANDGYDVLSKTGGAIYDKIKNG